jgi:hypothetical protein
VPNLGTLVSLFVRDQPFQLPKARPGAASSARRARLPGLLVPLPPANSPSVLMANPRSEVNLNSSPNPVNMTLSASRDAVPGIQASVQALVLPKHGMVDADLATSGPIAT